MQPWDAAWKMEATVSPQVSRQSDQGVLFGRNYTTNTVVQHSAMNSAQGSKCRAYCEQIL